MTRAISWFAHNGVAANVLMVLIVAGGLLTLPVLKQEVFPELSSEMVVVTVPYLGATPEEVEEAVSVRIEEAVQGLPGIKRIRSSAREGVGTVFIEALPDTDVRHLLDEVKSRVDTIETFPAETEKPAIQEVVLRKQVIDVAVHGDVSPESLRKAAEKVRDDLAGIDGISVVELSNAPPYEVSIEVSEEALRRYSLTFDDVARAVRSSSLDLPGGSVETAGGEILLRAKGQAYGGREFEDLTLVSTPDGARIRLGDVARVADGFADTDQSSRFDGKDALLVSVFRVGDQSALDIAEKVHGYVERARYDLPQGIELTTWQDDSEILRSRLDLLLRNGRVGLVLVFLSLALFLKLRLALWVAAGIPIAFLGAIWLLPALDISINLISLFAFIVVLGIVVDDAIVVGESIYTQHERGVDGVRASVRGALEVATPVIFAVLTTIAAFLPLLVVPGSMGKVMRVIPAIVIATLVFSLAESLFVLPHHLSHLRPARESGPRSQLTGAWAALQGSVESLLKRFIDRAYRPSVSFALRWRYTSLAGSIALLLVTLGLVAGGWIQFVFFPPVDADNAVAFVTMPQGTPAEVTARAVRRLEEAAMKVREELDSQRTGGDGSTFRHVLSSVGGQPFRESQNLRKGDSEEYSGAHLGEVNVQLAPAEERSVTSTEVARRWRELAGAIPDAIEVSFTSSLFSTGEAVNIQLSSVHPRHLESAALALEEELGRIRGVVDITDSFRAGKEELKISIRKSAEHLGLSLRDVAHQVRQAFYGDEAQRIQRGRDDVRVMVRYPEEERDSLADIENLRIRTAGGAEVPFHTVARVERGRGYATVERSDLRRAVNVTADVDQAVANPTEVNRLVEETVLPRLKEEFPGLDYTLEGEQREQRETMDGLVRGFLIALGLIYVLLAIPFRSYFQPLIVMSAIPFGLVGAVWGHVLMGMDLTMLSMFGVVALTGVIVNDSLVMVDFINRSRRAGVPALEAVRQAGRARFRPIFLTSLTTFAGLTPLLLERSMQARFLIPMAISLGFGVLFATAITLFLVPVSYAVLEDMTGRFRPRGAAPGAPSVPRLDLEKTG